VANKKGAPLPSGAGGDGAPVGDPAEPLIRIATNCSGKLDASTVEAICQGKGALEDIDDATSFPKLVPTKDLGSAPLTRRQRQREKGKGPAKPVGPSEAHKNTQPKSGAGGAKARAGPKPRNHVGGATALDLVAESLRDGMDKLAGERAAKKEKALEREDIIEERKRIQKEEKDIAAAAERAAAVALQEATEVAHFNRAMKDFVVPEGVPNLNTNHWLLNSLICSSAVMGTIAYLAAGQGNSGALSRFAKIGLFTWVTVRLWLRQIGKSIAASDPSFLLEEPRPFVKPTWYSTEPSGLQVALTKVGVLTPLCRTQQQPPPVDEAVVPPPPAPRVVCPRQYLNPVIFLTANAQAMWDRVYNRLADHLVKWPAVVVVRPSRVSHTRTDADMRTDAQQTMDNKHPCPRQVTMRVERWVPIDGLWHVTTNPNVRRGYRKLIYPGLERLLDVSLELATQLATPRNIDPWLDSESVLNRLRETVARTLTVGTPRTMPLNLEFTAADTVYYVTLLHHLSVYRHSKLGFQYPSKVGP